MDKNDSDEDDDDGNPNNLPGLYACHSCIVFYSTLRGLKVHVDAFHRSLDSGTIEPVRIPCEACNMTFIQRHNLEKHMQQVHSHLARPSSALSGSVGARSKHGSGNSGLNLTAADSTTSSVGNKAFSTSLTQVQHVKVSTQVKSIHNAAVKASKGSNDLSITRKSPRTAASSSTKRSTKHHFTPDQRIYPCDECSEAYRSETALLHHKKTSHKSVVQSPPSSTRNPRSTRNASAVEYAASVASDNSGKFKGHYFDTSDPQDVEFFSSVAQRIAENLQYHVDGRISDLKSGSSSKRNSQSLLLPSATNTSGQHLHRQSSDQHPSEESPSKEGYLETECKLKTNLISSLQSTLRVPMDDNLAAIKNYGHHYICSTCGSREPDVKSFYAHALNNHPNVLSNYIIVEASNTVPGRLLTWRYNHSSGLLNINRGSSIDSSKQPIINDSSTSGTAATLCSASNPISSPSSSSVKCTKCGHTFVSIDLLHGHMFECARSNHYNPSSSGHYGGIYRKRQPPSRSSSPENDHQASGSGYSTRSGRKRSSPASSVTPSTSTTTSATTGNKSGSSSSKGQSVKSHGDQLKQSGENQNDFNGSNRHGLIDGQVANGKRMESVNKADKNTCKRCNKKFRYADTLRKHRLSCLRLKIKLPSIASPGFAHQNNRKRLSLDELDDEEESIEEEEMDDEEEQPIDHNDPDFVIPKPKFSSPGKGSNKKLAQIAVIPGVMKESPAEKVSTVTESESNDAPLPTDGELQSKESNEDWKTESVASTYCFKGSPAQHHSCPFCRRGFTYLANYRKHMKELCPIKQQLEDAAKLPLATPSPSTAQTSVVNMNTSLGNISAVLGLSTSSLIDPTKSDLATTDLTTSNNQHKNELKNESNISTPTAPRSSKGTNHKNVNFKSFSCQVCHKIYFSHLDLMKHILSHKLAEQEQDTADQQQPANESCNNSKSTNDILSNLAKGGGSEIVTNGIAAQEQSPLVQSQLRNTVSEQEASEALAAGIILLDDVRDVIDTKTLDTSISTDSKMVVIEDIDDEPFEALSSDHVSVAAIKIGGKSVSKWPAAAGSSILLRQS